MTDAIVRGVIRSVLGGRRKRSGRAIEYLLGSGTSHWLANPTTLLTAAGVAWGIYDALQDGRSAPASEAASWPDTGGTAVPPAVEAPPAGPGAVPPIPAGAGAGEVVDDATRAVRLAVAAAFADGEASPSERAAVLAQAEAWGVRAVVEDEMRRRRAVGDIVAGVTSPTAAATLYVLAFTIARADEAVTGGERIFLARVAQALGLSPALVADLETEAAARIEAGGQAGTRTDG